ncbi:MAG: PD40 domain-containing protein [Anaerolineae bacterium]|nr:PD40 domain-containing protein [Anaerolineae bacterium]
MVNCDPDWSPDGPQLVFIRHAVGADHTRIAIGNIKDGRIRYVNTDDVSANFPSWSPDGKMVAFCGHSEGDEGWQLKVMNVDGSHRRNLAPLGDCEGASWSPDSRQLVFVAAGDTAQIGVINIDGTGMHFLTDKSGENRNLSPAWSSDGKHIAFRSLDVAPDANNLFIMDADGHNPHAFASGRSPSWSPDSKRLIYETGSRTEISLEISNTDGTNKLWITGQEIGNTQSIIPPTPFRGHKWSRAKVPQVQ